MFRFPFRPLPGGCDRPAPTPAARKALAALAAGLAVAAVAGCHSDEITRYRVPREEKSIHRLLGAIIPHDDKVWFVKLDGPDEAVKGQQGPFEGFVKSVHFPAGGQPALAWKAPEGWKEVKSNKADRVATFEVGPPEHPLEVAVTAFPKVGQMGSVLANVNRWRGQLGLPEIAEDELPKTTRQLKLDGAEATVVDLAGSGPGRMALRRQPVEDRPHARERALERPRLTYKTPPGWKEMPGGGFRLAAFRVTEGDESAVVTVIPLAGAAGDLLGNVNRWRKEVELPPVGAADLDREVQHLKAAGADAQYVDVTGEKAGKRQRILVAFLPREGQTWFFKMTGPADLVGRQKAAFEAFVASVQFGGGGNDQ